jgi:hypothetical protein
MRANMQRAGWPGHLFLFFIGGMFGSRQKDPGIAFLVFNIVIVYMRIGNFLNFVLIGIEVMHGDRATLFMGDA